MTDVTRILKLHYSLSRLTIDEWIRPLPPPALSKMQDPAKVNELIIHLYEQPSLASFSALPRLYFEEDFGASHPTANVTRMVLTYGQPRLGLPNQPEYESEHRADFHSYLCGPLSPPHAL